MDLRSKGEQNGLEIVHHSRFEHVLLDVGHHILGPVASVGGTQEGRHAARVDAATT